MQGSSEGTRKSLTVVVFADFTCPYSFIGQEQVDRLMSEYDCRVIWRPHWLHPEVPPEGLSQGAPDPERREATLKWLREMAPQKAANMRFPEKRLYSFLAFAGLEFANDYSKTHEFRREVFDAVFVRGEDIGQVPVLQECANRAGLDGDQLGRELTDGPELLQRAYEAVQSAADVGIDTTPTVIVGKTAVLGWNYYEVFETALAKQGYYPKQHYGAK